MNAESVDCCIAGCGPAGAVLGLLLARAGLSVLVLEKHADFLRDFRGDTIHPSTLELLDELGLAERFLALPHTEVSAMSLRSKDRQILDIEFSRMGRRGKFPFIAFVPQWDFLEFITQEAAHYATFELKRRAEVVDLVSDATGSVTGVRYRHDGVEREVTARLTVGADGRASRTREAAGLPRVETAPPMDVEWFRLSRRASDGEGAWLQLGNRRIVVTFTRGAYWQIAYVIRKGSDEQVRAEGLEAFRRSIAEILPQFADRVGEVGSWDDVKLLTVRADRLRRWYRHGYLAIGDAAHAMSPVGGVGINVAIQDAVAAANLLWQPLQHGSPTIGQLKRVQRQRELTVRIIQFLQARIQDRVLEPTLGGDREFQLPWIARALTRLPWVRLLPARILAYGVIRPHVRVPELAARTRAVAATSL